MKVTSGSWQGTAAAGAQIDLTGGDPALFGKRPLAIFCKGDGQRGWLKLANMLNVTDIKELSSTNALGTVTTAVIGWWTRGIVLGTHAEANNGGTFYHYIAIWEGGANDAAVITRVGTGSAGSQTTPFQPDVVIQVGTAAHQPQIWAAGMGTSCGQINALTFSTLRITGVTATTFAFGTSADANANGEVFYALVLKAAPGVFGLVTYTGSGVIQSPGALDFTPDAVLLKGNNAQQPVVRHRDNYGDSSAAGTATFTTGQITAMTAGGFSVGTGAIVNENAIAFYGLAFKDTRPALARRLFLRHPSRPFGRPFTAASAWNTPIPAGAQVDANNADMVRNLKESTLASGLQYIDMAGADQNPTYGVPCYLADAATPRRTITPNGLGYWAGSGQLPVPSAAVPAAGSDAHYVAYDRATDTIYECWQLDLGANTAGYYSAFSGRGRGYNGPLGDDGLTPDATPAGGHGSARAFGGALLAGAIRYDELFDAVEDARAGNPHPLPHALAIGMRNVSDTYTQSGTRYVGPRQGHVALGLGADGLTENIGTHDSGTSNTVNAYNPPMGARLRLKASVDVPTLAAGNPTTHVLGLTLQQYGAFLVDGAGATLVWAELPAYDSIVSWGGLLPRNALAVLSPAASIDTMYEWMSLPASLTAVR